MGCGCAGSTQPGQAGSSVTYHPGATPENDLSLGGPGTESYVWTGPEVTPEPVPVSEPAAAE